MSPESDYQRRARLEREARRKAQAKQRDRERQTLDRAESIAREKTAPEQHQHLAEARRRIEEREGRIGQELGRALEDRINNGPNQFGKGSIQRLVGLGNRVFGDGRTAWLSRSSRTATSWKRRGRHSVATRRPSPRGRREHRSWSGRNGNGPSGTGWPASGTSSRCGT